MAPGSSHWGRPAAARLAALALLVPVLAAPGGAEAQRRPRKVELATATVRVLDPAGSPVVGVEVELLVTRGDGVEDRRRGTTCADGAVSFEDVRADCVDFQASALLASGRVDGKLRPCGDGLDAFVVLPGSEATAPVAAVVAPTPYDEPAAAAPAPRPAAPEAEPGPPPAEPEPAVAAAPEAPVAPAAREPGPLTIGARAGIGFCREWFFRPGPDDPACDDSVSPVLDLEIDGGWHVADWLVLGARLGYGFFESRARFPDAGEGSEIDLQGTVAGDGTRTEDAANHRLHWGLGARALWVGKLLVAGADLVPLALLHHFTRGEGGGADGYTEFVVSAGVLAGLRIDRSWWLGAYARFLQPLPWIDDQRFLPGTLSFGVVAGWRSGRDEGQAAGATVPAEGEPPRPEPAADPDLDRRQRFIQDRQERGEF